MSSGKFDALAAKVGSKELAGWITNHNPKVAARAAATRARHKAHKATHAQLIEHAKSGGDVKPHVANMSHTELQNAYQASRHASTNDARDFTRHHETYASVHNAISAERKRRGRTARQMMSGK